MLTHSDQINEIGLALAKAQAEIKNAIKDAANPHFKSTYADLASVSDACRPALNKHGISVVQAPFSVDDKIGVETMLIHASGQWMRNIIDVRPSKLDAQGAGSAITYLRRYSLAAMAGVAPEDDDGNAASAQPQAKPQVQQPAQKEPADKAVVTAAIRAIRSCHDMDALNQLWAMSAAAWRAEVSAPGFEAIIKEKDARKVALE